jgi:glycosyltransferase involved in cell wall biosynthesis
MQDHLLVLEIYVGQLLLLIRFLKRRQAGTVEYERLSQRLTQTLTPSSDEDAQFLFERGVQFAKARERVSTIECFTRMLACQPSANQIQLASNHILELNEISLASQFFELFLLHPEQSVQISSVRHLQHLRGMANCLQPKAPVRIKHRANRTRENAALYCLWRSVPYDSDGYAMRSHYLLRSLAELAPTTRACTRFGYPWDERAAKAGTSVQTTRDLVDGVTYYRLGSPLGHFGTVPFDIFITESAKRIAQLARAFQVKVIHAASNWMLGYPAALASEMLDIPFIYEVRGLWELSRATFYPDYLDTEHFAGFSRMEAETARRAHLVMPITTGLGELLVQRGGIDPNRIRVVPNGVDPTRFEPQGRDNELAQKYHIADDEMVYGYVGSFIDYEGLPDLITATRILKDRGAKFKVLVVGDGPDSGHVSRRVVDLELQKTVILTGRVSFTDVGRYYSLIDVAIFPRRSFAVTEIVSPLKPFEAMALGKLVIGSDVAPIAEILRNGERGLTFRKGDVAALVTAMERGLNRRERNKLAMEGRRWVLAERTWKGTAEKILAGWREVSDR